MMTKCMYEGSEWDFDLINTIYNECLTISEEELELDLYPNQFEVITYEQMNDAMSSIGMPVFYQHWSFGKKFIQQEADYKRHGHLPYELVLNSSPCINYLMENNSATLQTLVIAHAAFGHNNFFKENYMFKDWTDAESIIDYLVFAKKYIQKCEERYGSEAVESFIDSCHALQRHGINRHKRPGKLTYAKEVAKQQERQDHIDKHVNVLWDTIVPKREEETIVEKRRYPAQPEENLLYFIEKNSPVLASWQREIIRIVRKINTYFHPQMYTKVMNEGWACYTHVYMMDRLYDKGLLSEGAMLEYLASHSGVVFQPDFDDQRFSGFNPYYLGLEIFKDIERICKNPTEEDKDWFPDIAGKPHLPVLKDAVANYRDESFIRQFLSPHLMRKMRLFELHDEKKADNYLVRSIHNERGYKQIRNTLANQYDYASIEPNIQVYNANLDTDRRLELHHYAVDRQLLKTDSAQEVLKHVYRLWGFEPVIISFDENGNDIDEITLLESSWSK